MSPLAAAWRCALTAGVVGLMTSASAQDAGSVRGTVVDQDGRAAGGARVIVTETGGRRTRIELETTGDGAYAHNGLDAGVYTVRAIQDELGSPAYRIRVRAGRSVHINLALQPGQRVAAWLTEAGDQEALSTLFAAGVEATRERDYETAVDLFGRAVELNPNCIECHFNLAVAYSEIERFAYAEAEFRQVLEIAPQYAAAYYGLSNVYARQGRQEEAASARGAANRLALQRLAAGRADAVDAVNRGISFLDGGNVEDAQRRFEDAVRLDASFAPGHYWLGVALAQTDAVDQAAAALQRYLQLAGDGEYAEQARAQLETLGR